MILAKHGHRVAMIERGRHPRLAIGESLVPTSAMWFAILGHKHDIAELRTLAHLDSISRNVGPTCGIKRGFGYVYHRDGQTRLDPSESSHFIGAKQPIFRESQFYRQDIDHYLVRVAEQRGVTYRDETTVTGVTIDDSGATIAIADNEPITARFVVDATGRNSILAEAHGLREDPCRLRHSSRTIFSHFRNVAPFEDIAPHATGRNESAGWSQGTLHHVFDGGWFWVIPFNNNELSTNDLVSVGVTVRTDRYPRDPNLEPAKEFQQFVERFPSSNNISARPKRPETSWGPTGSSTRRPHQWATGSYSSSTPTASSIRSSPEESGGHSKRSTWWPNTYSLHSMTMISARNAWPRSMPPRLPCSTTTIQMVHNAYRAMSDYDTWTAWLRLWFADEFLTTLPVLSATFRYTADGDLSVFDRIGGGVRPGTTYSFSEDLAMIVDEADRLLDDVDAGTLTPAAARAQIQARLADAPYLPHGLVGWAEDEFAIDLTPPRLARLVWWGRRQAPAGLRAEAFDFRLRDLIRLQALDAVRPSAVRRDEFGNIVPQKAVG